MELGCFFDQLSGDTAMTSGNLSKENTVYVFFFFAPDNVNLAHKISVRALVSICGSRKAVTFWL